MKILTQKRPLLAVTALFTLLTGPVLQAANVTWNGGGADDNFNTAANWGGTAPAASGDTINFAGAVRLTPQNNATYSFAGLTFAAASSGFGIGGNAFTLTGGITNSTAAATLQTISNNITLATNINIAGSASANLLLAGNISGAFALTNFNTANSTLSLAGNNSFTGPFINFVSAGNSTNVFNTLADAGLASALGAAPSATGTAAPIRGTLNASSTSLTMRYTGSGHSSDRVWYFIGRVGQAISIEANGSGALTLGTPSTGSYVVGVANAANASAGQDILRLAGSSASSVINTISGPIIDDSATLGQARDQGCSIVKDSTNTWALTGVNNFRGVVFVNNGTLLFNTISNTGVASALGRCGKLYVNTTLVPYAISLGSTASAGTLQYTGTGANSSDRLIGVAGNATLSDGTAGGSLTLNGGITNLNANANTLTLAGSGTSSANGVIQNPVGTLSLVKTGAGTWSLTSANTFTGTTTVSNGTLYVSSSAVAASGAITVVDGAKLGVTVSGTNQLAPASLALGSSTGGTIEFSGINSTNTPPVNTPGALSLTGANLINIVGGSFTAGNSYPLMTYASLSGAGTLALGTLPGGMVASLVTSGSGPFTVSLSVTTAPLKKWQAGTGNWDLATANWTVGGPGVTFANGDSVTLDDTATGSGPFIVTVTNASVAPGTVTFNNATKDYTINGNPVNGGSLFKNGTNIVRIAVNGTFSGGVTINAGTLQIGNGTNATGSLGTVPIVNNSALAANLGTNSGVNSADISGSGTFTMNGSGTYTLSGNNTYSGLTTINAGNLSFGTGGSSGPLPNGNFTNNGTLTINHSDSFVMTNNVSGSGGLAKLGTGSLTLGATYTYTGPTVVSSLSGGLVLDANFPTTITSSSGVFVTNRAYLRLDNGVTVSGLTATLSQQGVSTTPAGTVGALQTFNGANTWNGPVILASAGQSAETRLGVMAVGAANTLTINGVISGGGNSSNNVALGVRCSSADNLIVLSASNTYAGDTALLSGTMQLVGGHNRLPIGTTLCMGIKSTTGNGYLDLNGFDQEVAGLQPFQLNQTNLSATPNVGNTAVGFSTFTVNSTTTTIVPEVTTPFFIRGTFLNYDGTLSGNLNFVKKGVGSQTLSGVNTHAGTTTVSAGTLLVNGDNGASTVSATGGTLGGIGIIGGAVSVSSGATLAPGASGTNSLPATLTINNNLSLAGNVLIKLDKSQAQSNDLAQVSGTLANSGTGTVTLTNLGPALAVGDTFQIFSGAISGGNTLTVVGPAGFTYQNNLAANGSITVQAGFASYPTNITATVTGSTLSLTWPATHLGWYLQSQTNGLTVGLATNWVTIPNSNLTNSNNATINPAHGAVFFRLLKP